MPYYQITLEAIKQKSFIAAFYEDLKGSDNVSKKYYGYIDDNFDNTGTTDSVLVVVWHLVKSSYSDNNSSFEVRLFLSNSKDKGNPTILLQPIIHISNPSISIP